LKKIREEVQIPLVLHGATGIPLADVQTAISCGIKKMIKEQLGAFGSAGRA